MYCPSCGSNNQDDLKFCTRCGTNLGVVSDALRAGTSAAIEKDERSIALLKDYYRSRRMMLIGGLASALSLVKLAGPFLLGFPEKMIPIVILSLGFLLLGLLAFIWGLVKWNNSSSEIKALGISPSRGRSLGGPQKSLSTGNQSLIDAPAVPTNSIASKESVTEHTTHILDEDDHSRTIQARVRES